MIFDQQLYHGSYTIVEKPSLEMCMEGKDFGKGFYVTTDMSQAERFVRTSVKKAEKNGISVDKVKGYVSVYEIKECDDLKIYEFKTADRDWLHCVAAHRKSGVLKDETKKWLDYDIILGKIAIRLLLPEKLKNQICIRTKKAMERLSYVRCEECAIETR